MTIQFTLPAEHVAAAKAMITMVDPSKTEPTDDDVADYVGRSLLNGLLGLFPGVVLASQAQNAADLAALAATIQAGTVAAMNITRI